MKRVLLAFAIILAGSIPAGAGQITLPDLIVHWPEYLEQTVEVKGGAIVEVEGNPQWVRAWYTDGVSSISIYADMTKPQTLSWMLKDCRKGCRTSIRGTAIKDEFNGGRLADVEIIAEE